MYTVQVLIYFVGTKDRLHWWRIVNLILYYMFIHVSKPSKQDPLHLAHLGHNIANKPTIASVSNCSSYHTPDHFMRVLDDFSMTYI